MRINTNIMALNAYNNLENTNGDLNSSLAKLSSGYRINKAADDASGLVISENLKSQVSGLQQATRNAQDGISVVQTAEGALSSVQSMLQRIRDLVIQSANTGASDSTARQAAQNEIVQLRNEIDRIANTTSFGNQRLLERQLRCAERPHQHDRDGERHDRPHPREHGDGHVRPRVGLGCDLEPLGRRSRSSPAPTPRRRRSRPSCRRTSTPRSPVRPASPAVSRRTCVTSAAARGRWSSCATARRTGAKHDHHRASVRASRS